MAAITHIPEGRITEKAAGLFIDELNGDLAARGNDLRFSTGHRNGYLGLDRHRQSVRDAGQTFDDANVACGTPRECCNAALLYYTQSI